MVLWGMLEAEKIRKKGSDIMLSLYNTKYQQVGQNNYLTFMLDYIVPEKKQNYLILFLTTLFLSHWKKKMQWDIFTELFLKHVYVLH